MMKILKSLNVSTCEQAWTWDCSDGYYQRLETDITLRNE